MTKSTSGGCDQFETSPDAIEPELRTALCERRQTDRLKTNYSIDLGAGWKCFSSHSQTRGMIDYLFCFCGAAK